MFVVISLLLAAACVAPGMAKVLGQPRMRKAAAHFRFPWRGYQLIGMVLGWPRPAAWRCSSSAR